MRMTDKNKFNNRLALSVDGAAEVTSLSKHTIWAYIRDGQLAACHVGRRVLVPIGALKDLLGITSPQDPQSPNGQTAAGGAR